MADELVGSARVRIEPDTTGFQSTLLSELQTALDAASDAVATAFRDASTQASTSLADIGAAGFDPVTAAADSASTEVAGAFAGAGTDIESSLADAATAGDAALSGIGATAGDQIASSFAGVAGDIEGSITSAADAADASLAAIGQNVPDIELTVVADTSDADAAIAALGDTASQSDTDVSSLSESTEDLAASTSAASGGVGGLGGAVGILGNAASVTGGNVKGVGAAIGGLAPAAVPAVAAIGTAVAALTGFVTAGTDSIESNERFARTFGPLESAIREVNVGDLNGDLEDLAGRLGSSDEALESAASRIQTLGTASGAAAPEVEKTTEQIIALAFRTAALNPALGEAGDIANTLFTAFGKNGRGLANLGIVISQTEVQQRALNNTHKTAVDQLSAYDKQVASAQILTEKYGDTLAEAFAIGENNPAVRIRVIKEEFTNLTQELGEPVVVPAIDALDALAPVGLGLVTALGGIAQALVPVLDLVGSLEPELELVGTVIGFAGEAVDAFANSADGAVLGLTLMGVAASGALGPIGLLIGLATGAAIVVNSIFGDDGPSKEFVAGVKNAQSAVADTTRTVEASTEAFLDAQVASGALSSDAIGLAGGYDALSDAILHGGDALDDIRSRLLKSKEVTALSKVEFVGLAGAAKLVDKTLNDLKDELDEGAKKQFALDIVTGEVSESYLTAADASGNYAEELAKGRVAADEAAAASLSASVNTGEFTVSALDAAVAAHTAADGTVDYTGALRDLQTQAEAQAAAQANLVANLNLIADRVPHLVEQFSFLNDGVGTLGGDFTNLAVQLSQANVSAGDFDVIAAGLGVTTDQLHTFVDASNKSLADFVSTAVQGLPSLGDALDNAASKAEAAKEPLSLKGIADSINAEIAALAQASDDLALLTATGFDRATAELVKKGPEFVHAAAEGLRDGDGQILASINAALPTADSLLNQYQSQVQIFGPRAIDVTGEAARNIVAAFGPNFDLSSVIATHVDAATQTLVAGVDPMGVAGTQFARAATDPYGQIIGLIPVETTAAVAGATAAVTGGTDGFRTSAGELANQANVEFAALFTPGVGATAGVIAAQAAVTAGKPGVVSAATGVASAGAAAVQNTFVAGSAAAGKAGVIAAQAAIISEGLGLSIQASVTGVSIGRSFSQGIADGITSYVGRITAAAASAVNKAEAAARKAADSHSPSRLFAALGVDLSRGLAAGIADAESDVVAAAEAITRAAADATGSGSLGSFGASGGVLAGAVAAAAGGSSSSLAIGDIRVSVSVQTTGGVSEADATAIGNQIGVGVTQAIVSRQALVDSRINRGGK